MATTDETGQTAERVVLSHPSNLGKHGRDRIRQDYYRQWLRRSRETAAPGDEWDEFTDIGCCGSQMRIPFRVEAVDGGDRVTEDTEIEITEREACDLGHGWAVQYDE
ncbi:hypothetical protein [Halomicrobium salinisoli]|uniref:hypothetical protein n=1 Tax=Halomicrobium salinisoli TaxID=2878391 RepID=UPI001CF02BD3|nr:hypothetical protein [Halomicrobium salinisoli]